MSPISELEEHLAGVIPRPVHTLCNVLHDAGFRAWIVGGCVRDTLRERLIPGGLPREAGDWDLATDARPEQVQALFKRVVPTGIDHGTVTVVLGGIGFEVTTLRGEAGYSDGRRPDSVFYVEEIEEDLARRDFTINAIAFEPRAGKLLDPFGGLADLTAGLLRAVGDPAERFAEDGLRVLRAARFVATLRVELEPMTERAIEPSLASYRRVSQERIRDEWYKTLGAEQPSRGFRVMRCHGLLAITAPELPGASSREPHPAWERTLARVDACARDPALRLAALLSEVSAPLPTQPAAAVADTVARRLRVSNADRERVTAIVRQHGIDTSALRDDRVLRRWLAAIGRDRVEDVLGVARADAVAKRSSAELDAVAELTLRARTALAAGTVLSVRELCIGGRDLMDELGLTAGPALGQLLGRLFDLVLDRPELNTRDALLERAKELAGTG
jgi:tRNA nucleotidyltransferase (CCA-adding enzyme)